MGSRTKPCLILEGGGVKCAYQYGIMRTLDKFGVLREFGGIAGTSFGALNSALYISGGVDRMGEFWGSLSAATIFNEPMLDKIVDKIYSKQKVINAQTVLFVLSQWRNASDKHKEISDLYRKTVIDNVDEKAIRDSGMDFGLVTIEIPSLNDLLDMTTREMLVNLLTERTFIGTLGMKVREMTAEDIPEGLMPQFVAASANHLAFTPIEIGEAYYTDGGIYDNMPVKLMEGLGYTRFLCIRTNVTEPKKRWSDKANVVYITPSEEMGNCALFSKDKINDLIALGERDALNFIRSTVGMPGITEKPGGMDLE